MSRLTWLGIAVLTAWPLASWAQQGGTIRAGGEGVVYVMPDTASASFTVRSENPQLAVAREQVAAKMGKITWALKALFLSKSELSTESLFVRPLYKPLGRDVEQSVPQGEVAREIVGYAVTSSVTVTVSGTAEELTKGIAKAIDAALKNGATQVSGPDFSRKDLGEAGRQALELATKDAMGCAQAMAKGLGVTIKGFTRVSMFPEGDGDQYGGIETQDRVAYYKGGPPVSLGGPGGPPETPTEIAVTAFPVTATVYVTATY